MKTPLFILISWFIVISAPAQDASAIRVTTKVREDGSTSSTVLDPEKKTSEETITTKDGKLMQKNIYYLDEHNIAYGATFSDAQGRVVVKAGYKHDERGRITETTFTSPEGKYLGKRILYYGGGDKATAVEDYDANDRLITPKSTSAGIPDKKKRK